MSKGAHRVYIFILSFIILGSVVWIVLKGFPYYQAEIKERFFHEGHQALKPSGTLGHGYGVFGSLAMLIGVGTYMARKRMRSLAKLGVLKHWLEFHIFLCTLGPMLVLFHTAFKFGGLVAVSFWSMVAVFLSGILGRFIYIQIPHTIEGRQLSLNEVKDMKSDLHKLLTDTYSLDEKSVQTVQDAANSQEKRKAKKILKNKLPRKEYRNAVKLVSHEISLNKRIDRLHTMQNLFKYWHVAHLPFAFVMLIIMIIHVGVVTVLGYRWIF